MSSEHAPWIVVLAGGAGTRLCSLTVDGDGRPVPKQFCSLCGGRTLLDETLARAHAVTRADRVLVVVTAAHELWWRPQLAGLDPANVLVQPCSRGTAAGLLLPVGEALARDPSAAVAIMPSDHFFADVQPALATLRRALAATGEDARRPVLLGIVPDEPAADYGWIVPAGRPRADVPLPIARFVEKPPPATAAALRRQGALWNSFLFAADARALWQLCRARLPAVTDALERHFERGATRAALADSYRDLPSADFSRSVLQPCARQLRVLAIPECGWTDLGTPRRVAACLARQAGHASPAAVPGQIVLSEVLRGGAAEGPD